jgi:hypothetical protein
VGEKETLSTGERSHAGGGAIAIGEEGLQRTGGGGGGGAAGIAVSDPGAPADKPSTKREGAGGSQPAEASNLNLSKSNIDRLGQGDPDPDDAAKVKGSKSNSSERWADPGPDEPGGVTERSNLNSSKSNVYRAAGDAQGVAVDEPGVIDN